MAEQAGLPSSFLESKFSTKMEYEASLVLPPIARTAAKCASAAMKEASATHVEAAVQSTKYVFMFPPIGWQRTNSCKALYTHNEVFRNAIDECDVICGDLLPVRLKSFLFPAPHNEVIYKEVINRAVWTQITLFVLEYASASMWIAAGCRPDAGSTQ